MSSEVRKHAMYNINISYVIVEMKNMTSEVFSITDICIPIQVWSSLYVEKHNVIVKELHCSVKQIKASKVYMLEA